MKKEGKKFSERERERGGWSGNERESSKENQIVINRKASHVNKM
jgi:hypothetical protein